MIVFTSIFCLLGTKDVFAFHSTWHDKATAEVAKDLEFTTYSADMLQLGAWAPDSYQFLQEAIGKHLKIKPNAMFKFIPSISRQFTNTVEDNGVSQLQKMSIFFHFDNIHGELDSNEKFHFIFMKLLENTSKIIRETYNNTNIDDKTKRMIILFSIGTSLHMIQDFYAHSNWVDLDILNYGIKINDPSRFPTYFEARAFFQQKNSKFPFLIESGIFPAPTEGKVPLTKQNIPKVHDYMNHDNSQLINDFGVDIRKYHNHGLPATEAFALKHQQYAVATAIAASKEWVGLLAKDPLLRNAIQFSGKAKSRTLLFKNKARLLVEGLERTSCLTGVWDGPNSKLPEGRRCDRYKLSSNCMLINLARGSCEPLATTLVMQFSKFFIVYRESNIFGRLNEGIGNPETGFYDFSSHSSYLQK
ncbi:MAG: hypothetical protein R8L53_07545 [Mariprofundales bacterium]